jgi:hypothetical protein
MGEAYRVERQVRNEAYVLLGNQDEVSVINPKGGKVTIKGSRQLEKERTPLKGADLLIYISESKVLGYSHYVWVEDYVFYRDHVDLHMGKNIEHKWRKAPEQDRITVQANSKDLNAVLKTLKGSK